MQTLATAPATVLETLAQNAMRLWRAQSAGISIEEGRRQDGVFRWHAVEGVWSRFASGTLPRHASPCGTVPRENCSLLMSRLELAYPIPTELSPRVEEVLLVPFRTAASDGKPVGTVGVISHSEGTKFDREDLRLMESLAALAGAAYQTLVAAGHLRDPS